MAALLDTARVLATAADHDAGRASPCSPTPAARRCWPERHCARRASNRSSRRSPSTGDRRRTTTAPPLRAALADDGVDAVLDRPRPAAGRRPSTRRSRRSTMRPPTGHQAGGRRADGRAQRPAAPGSPVPAFAFPEPAAGVLGRAPGLRPLAGRTEAARRRRRSATSTEPRRRRSSPPPWRRGVDVARRRQRRRELLSAYGDLRPGRRGSSRRPTRPRRRRDRVSGRGQGRAPPPRALGRRRAWPSTSSMPRT